MRTCLALLALLSLVGCASSTPSATKDQEFAAMSRCAQAAEMLGWDGLSYSQKQVIMETARNEGCFGKPQAQEVIVR